VGRKKKRELRIPSLRSSPSPSSASTSTSAPAVWSVGIDLHRTFTCPHVPTGRVTLVVPLWLRELARLAQYRAREFLIYLRADIDGNIVTVADDFCVPRQRTSAGSVDVLESTSCAGYNAVAHLHPRGVTDFSGTDWTYINANNDVSVLLEGGEIRRLAIRKRVPCGKFLADTVDFDAVVYVPTSGAKPDLAGAREKAQQVLAEVEEKEVPDAGAYNTRYGTTGTGAGFGAGSGTRTINDDGDFDWWYRTSYY